MEAASFELKAGVTCVKTTRPDGTELKIEEGEVYKAKNPDEARALELHVGVKVAEPKGGK